MNNGFYNKIRIQKFEPNGLDSLCSILTLEKPYPLEGETVVEQAKNALKACMLKVPDLAAITIYCFDELEDFEQYQYELEEYYSSDRETRDDDCFVSHPEEINLLIRDGKFPDEENNKD
ncbi:MAG: hypothetical protein ACXVCY_04445 [Pseudobdellovibrionaceae bacterium]